MVRVCVAVGGLVRGQRLLLLFDVCAVTCGRSFTTLGVWGDLISFWTVLVFSPSLLSLLFLLPCYYSWLLLLSLFPRSFWLCVTGAWAGAGYGWWGSWLVAGRAGFWGALATWVGVSSSSPQVSGHPTSTCDAGVNGIKLQIRCAGPMWRFGVRIFKLFVMIEIVSYTWLQVTMKESHYSFLISIASRLLQHVILQTSTAWMPSEKKQSYYLEGIPKIGLITFRDVLIIP